MLGADNCDDEEGLRNRLASLAESDEEGLRNRLASLAESEPAYAATLNDLAILKLDQGETEEGQRLLAQLRSLRAQQLDEQSEEIRQSEGAPCSGSTSSEPNRSSADAGPSPSPAVAASSRASPGPPLARPRGAGNLGMGGGVAMFARALGGGRGGAGSRRPSGGGPGAATSRPGSARSGSVGPDETPQGSAASRSSSGSRERPAAAEVPEPEGSSAQAAAASQASAETAAVGAAAVVEAAQAAPSSEQTNWEAREQLGSSTGKAPSSAPLIPGPEVKGAVGGSEDAQPSPAVLAATAALRGTRRPSHETSAAAPPAPGSVAARSSPAKAAAAEVPSAWDDDKQAVDSDSGNGFADSGRDYRDYAERDKGSDDAAIRALLGDCSHVLEAYALTLETRTSHLEEFVEVFCTQEGRPLPSVKWVDDHHALLVCPDIPTARCLLQEDQGVFALRPFSEASAGAKAVAAAELLPPRERPKTTAAVAKRLLSHALGMRQLVDRAAERDLAEQRKAAREARREREQKIAAAWDDD